MKSSCRTGFRVLSSVVFITSFGSIAAAQTVFDQDVAILESDRSGVTLQYTVPEYSIESFAAGEAQFSDLYIPRTAQLRKDGQVEIPVKYVPLAVPPGAEVSITVLDGDYSDIGFKTLAPFFARSSLEDYEKLELWNDPVLEQS